MTPRIRFALMVSLCIGPATLAGCELLLTDPAQPAEITISFQVGEAPIGGTATAFSRVRRVFLRFTRADSSFRDTTVAAFPTDGVVRAGIALQTDERIDALGIGARLGFASTTLFEGATVVRIEPGVPTTALIQLAPVPETVRAERGSVTLTGLGASTQLASAVLFATGDTVGGLQGAWLSEDPLIVAVSPTGLAVALGFGQTRLEVRFDTLADTVLVDVVPLPAHE